MPSSGPVGMSSASPQSTSPAEDFVGQFYSGPEPGWNPTEIVQGFLAVSASYPANAAIARQYLVSSASRQWDPGWSVTVFAKLVPGQAVTRDAGRQASVDVTGAVQAAFNGSGQFVSAQGPGRPASVYSFNLVKVNGQWRISNPPRYRRLVTGADFADFYKPQDLYFLNQLQLPVLVPDSVFVPLGTSPTALASNLVTALLQGPKNTWLQNATSSFPAGTTLLGVTLDGATAVVNLGGALAHAGRQVLEQASAQLVWTLAGPQASMSSPIQSVELEIDGKVWIPPGTICGTSAGQGPAQKQAAYECYDPYPAPQASFSFVKDGTAWSRCGWEQKVAQEGSIGSVVPVFGRTGGAALGGQPCQGNGFVTFESHAVPPPAQLHSAGTISGVAVSPDGKYAADVSAAKGGDTLDIRSVTGAPTSYKPLKEPGATSLHWDRNNNLWFVQGGVVWMVSTTGQTVPVSFQDNGDVKALSIAPDGARIALVVQNTSRSEIELAAIDHSAQSADTQRGLPSVHVSIGQGVQLGPNLTNPVALTWYDADNLLVLNAEGRQNKLYEVPVDGQQSSGPQLTPPGVTSITAYGPANALVAGLSTGTLSVSASLEGPWQPLGVRGQNPAYPG